MPSTNIDHSVLPKTFELMQGGCNFAGTLYRCKEGGHDLYLNVSESELDSLEVALITQLRYMSNDRKEAFVDHVPMGPMDPRLVRASRQALSRWIRNTLSVERTLADRFKELIWTIFSGDGLSGFFRLFR